MGHIAIAAAYAIIKLVLPKVLAPLGEPAVTVVQVLNIVMWAAIAIVIVIFAFMVLSCLFGGAGALHLPR